MNAIDWLMTGPAFVRYRCLLDFAGLNAGHHRVRVAYREMLADSRVQTLIEDVNQWENQAVITRHNDAVHPLHKLVFAADIGIRRKELRAAADAVQRHGSAEGPFQVRIRIPRAFGGNDEAKWDWVATDAPLVLYSLLRLGVRNRRVERGVTHPCEHVSDGGFPCLASASMGRFNGPGRRADPDPTPISSSSGFWPNSRTPSAAGNPRWPWKCCSVTGRSAGRKNTICSELERTSPSPKHR